RGAPGRGHGSVLCGACPHHGVAGPRVHRSPPRRGGGAFEDRHRDRGPEIDDPGGGHRYPHPGPGGLLAFLVPLRPTKVVAFRGRGDAPAATFGEYGGQEVGRGSSGWWGRADLGSDRV